MKKSIYVIVAALTLTLTGCGVGDVDQIQRVLKAEGCTDVQLAGYDYTGCGQGDNYSCGFSATRNGVKVTGVVCSGMWKGATVRYY